MASFGKKIVGIDLGTTRVKAVVVDCEKRSIDCSASFNSVADIANLPALFHEQNPAKIFVALENCLQELKAQNALNDIGAIAICGQMHGIMLWNPGADLKYANFSSLITWQDQRCREMRLPAHTFSGYGNATLKWIFENQPALLKQYCCAGTVADYLVAKLCNLSKPVMTTHMAASWGFFNLTQLKWNDEIIGSEWSSLLPETVQPDSVVGKLAFDWFGICEGTPIFAALGDFQASVYPLLQDGTAILNIGTSAQLCCELPLDYVPFSGTFWTPNMDCFPFLGDRKVAIAASLNGGNVLQRFVKILQEWILELAAVEVPESKIWAKLLASNEIGHQRPNFQILPRLFGERCRDEFGEFLEISGLRSNENFSLNAVTNAIIDGLVHNLSLMFPPIALKSFGIKRLCAAGQANQQLFLQSIRRHFANDFQVVIIATNAPEASVEAAFGAALLAADAMQTN